MIDKRITDAFFKAHGFRLDDHLIVLAVVGSESHGTKVPPTEEQGIDDHDLMGFLIPPLHYTFGLKTFDSWVFQYEELDVVIYSLEKAVRLLLKNNPNIVGMLWLRDEEYVHRTPAFDTLRKNRDIFSSKKAADSFIGYATGQLKKMEAFDKERMYEYEELLKQIDYWNLDHQAVLNKHPDKMLELLGQYDRWPHKDSAYDYGGAYDDQYTRKDAAELLRKFRQLHTKYFSGYMGEKRKAMVMKYNYDVKNAAHTLRLLRMGEEFLRTGQLNVFRTHDAQELIDIKQGKWTLEQVKAAVNLEAIREAERTSSLPDQPDYEAADRLLMQMVYAWHFEAYGH